MFTYETVSEAVNDLAKRGYDDSLTLGPDCLYCTGKQRRLDPDEFQIDEVYRFEGNTDPADETIVYAVSGNDGTVRGTLVNAYGAYSESSSQELVDKLSIRR